MAAKEPYDSDLQGQYQAIETLCHYELDWMLGLGGPAVFPSISIEEKCKLIRCLLSARLGNRVTRVWVEGRGDRMSYVARFDQGDNAEGKFADLKTADADADCDCKLPDLPSDVLRVIVGLVVKEPKDGLRMMGICRRMRRVVLDEKLPVMTKLTARCSRPDHLLSYNRMVRLINLSGSWLHSVDVSCKGLPFEDLRETSAEAVTALLPELRDLRVYQSCCNGDWILSQFASVAPYVQRLAVVGKFPDQVMDWIRRLPLEELDLQCSCRHPRRHRPFSGSFLSSNLKSVKLHFSAENQVRADFLLSMLSRCSQTLRTFEIQWGSLFEDCDLESFDLDDCQCTFIDIDNVFCSALLLGKLCHQNLTHLHLYLDESDAAQAALCVLFENGRFSLRKVQLGFPFVDPTNAIRALLSRNQFLEVVYLFSHELCTLPSSPDVSGLRHLRVFVLYNCEVAHPEAWLAGFSADRHPHLNLFGWYYEDGQPDSAVEAVWETSRRMPGCAFRVADRRSIRCSHFAFQERNRSRACCRECDLAIELGGCCIFLV